MMRLTQSEKRQNGDYDNDRADDVDDAVHVIPLKLELKADLISKSIRLSVPSRTLF